MDLPAPTPALFPEAPPAVIVRRPETHRAAAVFTSPHSGQDYPHAFLSASRLTATALRRSEDSFVDELFAAAPAHGAPLLAATFPRAFCDPNREPWELDPLMFEDRLPAWVNTTSARVGAGLGTIARVVATGEAIYRQKLRFAEAEARIRDFWQPYHDALRELVSDARTRFGHCLLIDCHSMPAQTGAGTTGRGPDFVLGDAHGTACAPHFTAQAECVLTALGYRVRRNDPYAGGYITRHYGRPRENVHALQIEIARRLYMDEVRIEKSCNFIKLQADMTALIAALTA